LIQIRLISALPGFPPDFVNDFEGIMDCDRFPDANVLTTVSLVQALSERSQQVMREVVSCPIE
jgi:hypothetical protein